MAEGIDVEVTGIIEVQRKMTQIATDLYGVPMVDAFRRASLLVTRDARINAPVDTGRLRASITPEVIADETMMQGIVGSNVTYAPYQELGTRFMQGKFYLRRALEANTASIIQEINDAVAGIIRK